MKPSFKYFENQVLFDENDITKPIYLKPELIKLQELVDSNEIIAKFIFPVVAHVMCQKDHCAPVDQK